MPVTVHIPSPLRLFTGGLNQFEIDSSPGTVAEAFDALWQQFPGMRYRIVTEQGQVREHLNIFVGEECIRYTGWLQTPIEDGCEIFIIPAVSGGSGVPWETLSESRNQPKSNLYFAKQPNWQQRNSRGQEALVKRQDL